jgi:hypothetical protein
MRLFISNGTTYSSIKCIEVTEPIPVIEGIGIIDYPSFETVKIINSFFVKESREFFTPDTTSTVHEDFLVFEFYFIFFDEILYFSKINRSCRDSSFEMT